MRRILDNAGIAFNDVEARYRANPTGFLTMRLEIQFQGPLGPKITNPEQDHYFDFDAMEWKITDVGPLPQA